MENAELIFTIAIGVSFLVAILSGMYITHFIYEEEQTSFFEMYILGLMMSIHLVPMFFSNSYNDAPELKKPLWIFRISLVLTIGLIITKAKLLS